MQAHEHGNALPRWGRAVLELILAAAIVYGIHAWRTGPLLPADGAIRAPAWALEDLQGKTHSSDDFTGRPTVLYFFAPWCSICNASAHQLRWFIEWVGDEVNVVVIALDWQTRQEVLTYATRHRLDVPVLLGDRSVAAQFRVRGFPTYYLLNPSGQIIGRDFGYTTALGLWLRTRGPG